MNLQITHTTRYEYDREVKLMPHLLYLRPRDNPLLTVNHFEFAFTPKGEVVWMRDDFDNLPASVRFSAPSRLLEIRSHCSVTTTDIGAFDFLVRDYATQMPFDYEPLHRFNLSIYLDPPQSDTATALIRWLDECFTHRPADTVAWLFSLNETIQRNLRYQRRDELGIQSPKTTIELGSGSCRDYAALLIACARSLGLAARFVSGYMYADANDRFTSGDMHAWVEIFLPGAGWRGLDPTHGIFCDNTYVPVAHAVVAESVNPVQGSFFSPIPATSRLSTEVRVERRS